MLVAMARLGLILCFFTTFLLVLHTSASSSYDAFQTLRRNSKLRSTRGYRKRLLDHINRPYIATFNLSDGSIVDCVRIQDQLGVQHNLLKDHQILKEPLISFSQSVSDRSFFSANNASSTVSSSSFNQQKSPKSWQVFHQEHGSCPEGSIPVQRLQLKDLHRMKSPEVFFRKHPGKKRVFKPNTRNHHHHMHHFNPPAVNGHQYAIVQAVGRFSGSQAYLSIWDPAVASSSDFSLSQLWLGGGSHESINTVEAGWQVYELLNGDRSPHLFIFWTADSYKNSGCYNLRCPGFIQTSPRVLLGGAISSISSPDSSLFFKKFLVFKDPVAWWLQVDDEWVGYWPAALFSTLGESSQWMQWGGEVCLSGASDGPQLSTQMGSGFFPVDGTARAASQCELGYLDAEMRQYDAVDLAEFSTDPECYTAKHYYDHNWGSYIIFGGRGCET